VVFGSNFEEQFGSNYGKQLCGFTTILTNDYFEEDNFGE
jgi:hypothetical protein